MIKIYRVYIIFALILPTLLNSQQLPQFTQYMFNTIAINPAYAGVKGKMNISFLNRNQWVGVNGAPVTQTLAVHSGIPGSKVGVGLSLIHDKLGYENNTFIYADFSYTIDFERDYKLSFGIKAGMNKYGLENELLTDPDAVGDQYLDNIIYSWCMSAYHTLSVINLEINGHRTKLVWYYSIFFYISSSYVKDDETLQIIIESQNRIRSMSYIHESLYQTKDFSHISFDAYITNLVQNLVHSYQISTEKIKLKLDVGPINLALDQAIPCGLILNELITNAMKYAYPYNKGGEISISVKEKDNKISMSIADFGVGFPKGFKIDDSETLGLSLVDTLIDQVDGQLSLKTEGGTEFLIIFEKQEF
mgnify:CR=1 FL=1